MSYTPITSTEIETGAPVSNTTQTKIKDNLDSLEERVSVVENGGAVIYPPIIFRVNGLYESAVGQRIVKTTANFNLAITGVRLIIDTAGTSGTTEVNLLYKRGAGAYTSVLTTRPSVAFGAGNDAVSSNTVLNPGEVNIQTGDILAIDLTSVQTNGRSFMVRVDYNKT